MPAHPQEDAEFSVDKPPVFCYVFSRFKRLFGSSDRKGKGEDGLKLRQTFIILTILLSLPYAAGADIYRYVDKDGVLHFTNTGGGQNQRRVYAEPAQIKVIPPSAAQERTVSLPGTFLSTYSEIIHEACGKHGVDPALVHAIVKVESDFNATAVSRKGAMGLMQLMPQTAADMNVKNTFNPTENIAGGVKYIRYLLDRYEGNLELVLAAYNAGETNVKKWGTIPPFSETRQYVKKVLAIYNNGALLIPTSYTVYIGYGSDGTLLLTDNPSNHQSHAFTRKMHKSL